MFKDKIFDNFEYYDINVNNLSKLQNLNFSLENN